MQEQAQQRTDRQQQHDMHLEEQLERHREQVEAMEQRHLEGPAGSMGGGAGGGKR
jgi:hypothetical protein